MANIEQPENTHPDREALARQNKRVLTYVLLTVCIMVGLAYVSVPLYSLFCRVTGFGGTTQVATSLPDKILERKIIVRFDANTASNLPWIFRPEVKQIEMKIGERSLTNFIAQNKNDKPIAGTAVFNVTPLKAGKYFQKIECFCFSEQILQPQQRVNMPVLFYIDPKMDEDEGMDDVSVITLSYSFFRTESAELEKAMEEFYEGSAP